MSQTQQTFKQPADERKLKHEEVGNVGEGKGCIVGIYIYICGNWLTTADRVSFCT